MNTTKTLLGAATLAAVTFAAPAESHQPPTREPLLVTLTFDDSTRDHITAAAPELERRGLVKVLNYDDFYAEALRRGLTLKIGK